MYRHLIGPLHSRRLGLSLGIDLVPLKTCNLNCLYCECGGTRRFSLARREYVPMAEVCAELTHYLAGHPPPDYLTFSGSGEPLLHSRAGDILAWMQQHYPGIPRAVLTNGTLFSDPEVRRAVTAADLICPSLDAATQAVFRKIDRPHPALRIERIIEGLIQLRLEYPGKIWLEVFILPGVNDGEEELEQLRLAIVQIAPDLVQLNSLDRPGAVADIRTATRHEFERIARLWGLPNVEIISRRAGGPHQL